MGSQVADKPYVIHQIIQINTKQIIQSDARENILGFRSFAIFTNSLAGRTHNSTQVELVCQPPSAKMLCLGNLILADNMPRNVGREDPQANLIIYILKQFY